MLTQEEEWLLREKYHGIKSENFRSDLERLKKGEPVAYVIGFSTFLGCHIDLSLRPLIPRTETEYWVEQAIQEIREAYGSEAKLHLLDLFSGSGCIGIAALSRLPNATADFADIDENALEEIRKNLALNEIDPARSNVYRADVFNGLPESQTYDVIFANPPYIAEGEKSRVGASVLGYEPHTALFSGDDGLEHIKKMLAEAGRRLAPHGRFYFEHDDFQKETIRSLLAAYPEFEIKFHTDQFGVWRWISLVDKR